MEMVPSGLAVVGLLAACAAAPRPAAEPEQVAPSFDRLVEDYESRLRVVMDAEDAAELAPAPDEQEGPTFSELTSEYVTRFRALAEAHPGEEDSGKALAWIAVHAWKPEDVEAAVPALVERFADRPYMLEVCTSLSRPNGLDRHASESLRSIAETTHVPVIRAWALYCAARQDLSIVEMLGYLRDGADPAKAEALRAAFPPAAVSWLDSIDPDRMQHQAEDTLETLERSAGDLSYKDRKISDIAASALFELRDLAIGRTAPNIEGEDVDGLAFSLDQYRGRVVVLSFWGNW